MSESNPEGTRPPETAITVSDLLWSIRDLLGKQMITPETPIAMLSDAEGNRMRWMIGFTVQNSLYRPDQFPVTLDQLDPQVNANGSLVVAFTLVPAD